MESLNTIENSGGGSVLNLVNTYMATQGVDMSQFYKPPHDMAIDAKQIKIRIDIPGVRVDSVDVEFFNNIVEISGTRDDRLVGDLISHEIMYGCFTKKIKIPISVVNRESVDVSADNGVLNITINRENEERNKFKIKL